MEKQKIAVILGAGPAGLTAAYELIDKTNIKPVIIELDSTVGGLSKTINYKGNLIDIGGHRFFSKSSEIMQWWQNIFSVQGAPSLDDEILKRKRCFSQGAKKRNIKCDEYSAVSLKDPQKDDDVFLVRQRVSRIFYLRKFFNYPISLSFGTIRNLGIINSLGIVMSYLKTKVFGSKKKESDLEEFFINRFGKKLYLTFFKDYTEKIWGIKCSSIDSSWGHQRVKGLSIGKTLGHMFKRKASGDIYQKSTETSLINKFLYPKFGPGQLWQEVGDIILRNGGVILTNTCTVKVNILDNKCCSVEVEGTVTKEKETINVDYLLSSIAIKDFVNVLGGASLKLKTIASNLSYRDFITVGILLKKLKIKNTSKNKTINNIPPDNWIYVQERDVKVCRIQIFNNWSPYMVKNFPDNIWIGMEYICNEGDGLWNMNEEELKKFGIKELEKICLADKQDVIDATVIKIKKAYPCYFGKGYDNFNSLKKELDKLENVFLIGRNGMHRYNNQDHAMLTAIEAVKNIVNGKTSHDNIWNVNVEREYHEEKAGKQR